MYLILVWYINKMATDRGGGAVDGRHSNGKHDFGPRLKSPPGYNFFLLIFMFLLNLYIEDLIYDFRTVTYNLPLKEKSTFSPLALCQYRSNGPKMQM